MKIFHIHQRRWVRGGVVFLLALAMSVSSFPALAFNGPASGQAAGSGSGAIGVGTNNDVSVGTSTASTNTKFLVQASSTGDTGNYTFKIIDSSQNPLLIIRNDGSIAINTSTFSGALNVNGLLSSNNGFTGSLAAGNVTAGTFASNYGGGNFTFPGNIDLANWGTGLVSPNGGSITFAGGTGNLLINTYTASADLVVNTSEFVVKGLSGDVGIGTASPGGALDIQGASTGMLLSRIWNTDTSGNGTAVLRIANSGNETDGSEVQFSDNNYYTASIAGDRNQGLTFRTGNAGSESGLSNRMVILPNGNVGINDISPASNEILAVEGPSKGIGYQDTNTSIALGIGSPDSTHTGFYVGSSIANPFVTSVLYFNASGTVTIPGNLNVSGSFSGAALTGTLSAANVSAATFGSNVGGGTYSFPTDVCIGFSGCGDLLSVRAAGSWSGEGNTTASFGSLNSASSSVALQTRNTNGQDLFAVFGNGTVGINGFGYGSPTPASTLDVNGNETIGSYAGNNAAPSNGLIVSGNVGIGTAAPYTRLQIASPNGSDGPTPGTATGALAVSNQNNLYGLNVGVWSNGSAWLQDERFDGTATTYNLALQPSGGNVGIGTTNPTSGNLQVEGAPGIVAIQTSNNSDNPELTFNGAGSSVANEIVSNMSNNNLQLLTNNGSGSYNGITIAGVSNNGDVGINNTNPTSTLSVNGNANITGTLTAGTFTGTLNAGNVSAGTFGSNVGNGGFAFPGTLKINTTDAGATEDIGGTTEWFSTVNNNPSAALGYSSGNDAGLLELFNGGTETTFIGSNQASFFDGGNVGIGTTVPAASLDVKSASGDNPSVAQIRLETTNYTSNQNAEFYFNSAGSNSLDIKTNYSNASNRISLDPGDTTVLTALGSGDVGIGTTAPTRTLSVNATTNSYSSWNVGGTEEWVAGVEGGSNNNRFILYNTGGAGYTLTALTNGDVGIDTTSPDEPLTVRGDVDFGRSGGSQWFFQTPSTDMRIVGEDSGANLDFIPAGAGDVAIGTTVPDTLLTVDGGISSFGPGTNHYYNVASYEISSSGQTGTLEIRLPKGFSSTMLEITIKGYDYSGNGAWSVTVGGYNYGDHNWYNPSASTQGRTPFNEVRLANDGTYNYILLGTTATTWQYPAIEVSDVITSYSGTSGWGTGWGISLITSESGLTVTATPQIDIQDNGGNINIPGSLTAGSFNGLINAGNVTNGTFGSNGSGGNYYFPALLALNGYGAGNALALNWNGAGYANLYGSTNPNINFEPTSAGNMQVNALANGGGNVAAFMVEAGTYPTDYQTELGVMSGAQGVLELGNNGENDIRFGNYAPGGYGNIYVNNSAQYNAASNGTLAMQFQSNGNVTAAQSFTVNGGLNAGNWVPGVYSNWSAYGTGAGGAAIYNDDGSYQALMIVGNNSAGADGNRRQVHLWDDLTVDHNLTVSSNASIAGTLSAGGYTGAISAGNITAGTFGSNYSGGNYGFPGNLSTPYFDATNNYTSGDASYITWNTGSGGDYYNWYVNSQGNGSGVGTRTLQLWYYPYDSNPSCCQDILSFEQNGGSEYWVANPNFSFGSSIYATSGTWSISQNGEISETTSGSTQAYLYLTAPSGIWAYTRINSGGTLWDLRTNNQSSGCSGDAGAFSAAYNGGCAQLAVDTNGYIGINPSVPLTQTMQFGANSFIALPGAYAYAPSLWDRGYSGIILAGSNNSNGSGWSYGSRIVNVDNGNGLYLAFDTDYTGTWTNNDLVISGENSCNGCIGMGTATPGYDLAFGSQYYNIGWAGGSGVIMDNDGYGTRLSMLGASVIRLTNDGYQTGGGSTGLFVSGNEVGIGTASPSASLTVATGGGGDALDIDYNQVWATDNGSADAPLYLNYENSGDTFINIGSGSVGIGTTSPGYKLEVNGDIMADGWLRTTGNDGWYSQTYGIGWYALDTTWDRTYNNASVWTASGLLGSNGGLTVGYGGTGPNTSGGAIIAGSVGINTTSPGATLEVNGTGKFDGHLTGGGGTPTLSCGSYATVSGTDTDGVVSINGASPGAACYLYFHTQFGTAPVCTVTPMYSFSQGGSPPFAIPPYLYAVTTSYFELGVSYNNNGGAPYEGLPSNYVFSYICLGQ